MRLCKNHIILALLALGFVSFVTQTYQGPVVSVSEASQDHEKVIGSYGEVDTSHLEYSFEESSEGSDAAVARISPDLLVSNFGVEVRSGTQLITSVSKVSYFILYCCLRLDC